MKTTGMNMLLLTVVGSLVTFVRPTVASITFSHNSAKHNYSTYDPLMVQVPYYRFSGPIHQPQFIDDQDCKFSQVDAAHKTFSNTSSTIAVITELSAINHGCKTIAQISAAVADHSQATESLGLTPLSALLILLQENDSDVSGGPSNLLSISHKPSIPDGKISIPTALLPAKNLNSFMVAMEESAGSLSITLEQESGPWNSIFFSANYSAARWFLVAICGYFMAYSLVKVALLLRSRTIRFEKSTIVLALAMVASSLIIAVISMNQYTLASTVMRCIGNIVIWFAFYFTIYTWSSILNEIRQGTSLPLQISVSICAGITFVIYLVRLVFAFTPQNTAEQTTIYAFAYLQTAIYLTLIFIIVHHDNAFRAENYKESHRPSKQRIFKTLRISIAICILTLIFESITNAATAHSLFHGQTTATVANWIINDFCYVFRCVGLFLMYSIRKMKTVGLGADDYYSIFSREWTQTTSAQPSPKVFKPELRYLDTSALTSSTLPREHLTVQIPPHTMHLKLDRILSPILYDNPLFTQNITPTAVF
ncbi:hypothetical protein BDF19DRAFT_465709 [Syncephalis fuscata]|nr:hypothetical protein BDF19DRAFT_465709 [Syncephalis fuscata]